MKVQLFRILKCVHPLIPPRLQRPWPQREHSPWGSGVLRATWAYLFVEREVPHMRLFSATLGELWSYRVWGSCVERCTRPRHTAEEIEDGVGGLTP